MDIIDPPSSSDSTKSQNGRFIGLLLVALMVGFSATYVLVDNDSSAIKSSDGDDTTVDTDNNSTDGDSGVDGASNDSSTNQDLDSDGIPDGRDQCPATPRNVEVDLNGCRAPLTEGVWMHTRFGGKGAMFEEDNMTTWNQTLESINAYGLFIDEIQDIDNMEELTTGLAQNDVDLVVESGGPFNLLLAMNPMEFALQRLN